MGLLTPRIRHSLNPNQLISKLTVGDRIIDGNRKSIQSMPTTPSAAAEDEDLVVKVMLVNGENWGIGQSSIVKRFVENQFQIGYNGGGDFRSKHVTKSYSKEHVLTCQRKATTHEEQNKETQMNTHHLSNNNIELTNDHTNTTSPSTPSPLPSEISNSINTTATTSSKSITTTTTDPSLFSAKPTTETTRNIILQIEDYIPSYITDLETTDDCLRLSTDFSSVYDYHEQVYLQFKRNQQDHYYEKDAFLVCFDGRSEDFMNYVYNEIETIRNACDEFTKYKVIVLVLTKQDLVEEETLSNNSISVEKREQMIQKLLEDTKLELFRVSAKDNINIQELFDSVSDMVLKVKEQKSKLKAKLKKRIDSHIPKKQQYEHQRKCFIQ